MLSVFTQFYTAMSKYLNTYGLKLVGYYSFFCLNMVNRRKINKAIFADCSKPCKPWRDSKRKSFQKHAV